MKKFLKTLGYLKHSGRVDSREIMIDIIIIAFLLIMGVAIGANL